MKRLFLLFLLLVTAMLHGSFAFAAEKPIVAAPDSVYLGQPFMVRLTSAEPLAKVAVLWQGKTVRPEVSRWNEKYVARVLLGTDVLRAKPGKKRVTVSARVNGKPTTFKETITVRAKEYPEQRLTLPKKMVTPTKPETLAKIKKDRAAVGKALSTMSQKRHWEVPLERPVPKQTVVSSVYGLKRFLNDKPRNPHRGIDFAAPAGSGVHALADGVVVLADEHYFAGNSVYVDHGQGVISLYFHLSKVLVKEGQHIRRGETVGLVGKTGRATGAHLHLSVHVPGGLVDPAPLFTGNVSALLGLEPPRQAGLAEKAAKPEAAHGKK